MEELLVELNADNGDPMEASLRAAVSKLRSGEIDDAARHFAAVGELARTPGRLQRIFYLARSQLELTRDRFNEADALAGAAERGVRPEEDRPRWLQARTMRAEIALTGGAPKQALRLLDGAELDARGLTVQAHALYEGGDYEAARETLGTAVDVPDRFAVTFALTQGIVLGDVGALDRAEALLRATATQNHAAPTIQALHRIVAARIRLAFRTEDSPHDPKVRAQAWLDEAPPFAGVPCPTGRRNFTDLIRARCLTRVGAREEATAVARHYAQAAADRPLCATEGWLALAEATTDPGERAEAQAAATKAAGDEIVAPFHEY